MTELNPSAWPNTIVQDRYRGTYSRGEWLAIANADLHCDGQARAAWVLKAGPSGGDIEACAFWTAPPPWIAAGRSPNAALDALTRTREPGA